MATAIKPTRTIIRWYGNDNSDYSDKQTIENNKKPTTTPKDNKHKRNRYCIS